MKTATKHYFKIKYDGGLTEYTNVTSHKSFFELVNILNETINTSEQWAKGLILDSIVPATEIEYVTWSLAIKHEFHFVNFPN